MPVLDLKFRSQALSLARVAAAAVLLLGVAACRPQRGMDFSATINTPLPASQEGLQQEAVRLGQAYDRKPGERNISMRYALVLRHIGQHAQAVAVLQRATLANVNDAEVSAAYGKALADTGRFKEASEVLALAHSPDRPNWRLLSAQGSVSDQMGDHPRAQEMYLAALKLAPGEPTILSNLGLSYALSRRLGDAERVLTEAAANPRADERIRANLAMVRSLKTQGGAAQAPSNAWAQIRKAEAERKKQAQ